MHSELLLITLVIIKDSTPMVKIQKGQFPVHETAPRGFNESIQEYNLSLTIEIFNDYELKYGKKYDDDMDKLKLFDVFKENLRKINHLNQFAQTSQFMVNEFSCMALDQFTESYTGFNRKLAALDNKRTKFAYKPSNYYSTSKDYRDGGALIVKHQTCRNSYVHSAIGNLEAQYERKYRLNMALSEQQAFDCEPNGNCIEGGVPHHVFDNILRIGGLMPLIQYPPSDDKGICKSDPSKSFAKIKSYLTLDTNNEDELLAAVDVMGPLSVSIYVSESVKHYHSGILDPRDCQEPTNHAVVIMGYGTEKNTPYWILKNSWGFDWGEGGYMRLIRGKNACNIGEYAATVVLDDAAIPAPMKDLMEEPHMKAQSSNFEAYMTTTEAYYTPPVVTYQPSTTASYYTPTTKTNPPPTTKPYHPSTTEITTDTPATTPFAHQTLMMPNAEMAFEERAFEDDQGEAGSDDDSRRNINPALTANSTVELQTPENLTVDFQPPKNSTVEFQPPENFTMEFQTSELSTKDLQNLANSTMEFHPPDTSTVDIQTSENSTVELPTPANSTEESLINTKPIVTGIPITVAEGVMTPLMLRAKADKKKSESSPDKKKSTPPKTTTEKKSNCVSRVPGALRAYDDSDCSADEDADAADGAQDKAESPTEPPTTTTTVKTTMELISCGYRETIDRT